MIVFFKKFMKLLFITLPKKYISRLGFVNYYKPYINGSKERLILKGKYQDEDFANTIFNTRSGFITLEPNVFFSQNVMIVTGRHDIETKDFDKRRSDVQEDGMDIFIGEGTWLASGSIVLGNVCIGKGCVIGAGAVVTKDVPDYSFVAGIPAKVVKSLC